MSWSDRLVSRFNGVRDAGGAAAPRTAARAASGARARRPAASRAS